MSPNCTVSLLRNHVYFLVFMGHLIVTVTSWDAIISIAMHAIHKVRYLFSGSYKKAFIEISFTLIVLLLFKKLKN